MAHIAHLDANSYADLMFNIESSLIESGYVKQNCSVCGFVESRLNSTNDYASEIMQIKNLWGAKLKGSLNKIK